MRIAVCVHLYHTDMWDEIENYLNKYCSIYTQLPSVFI